MANLHENLSLLLFSALFSNRLCHLVEFDCSAQCRADFFFDFFKIFRCAPMCVTICTLYMNTYVMCLYVQELSRSRQLESIAFQKGIQKFLGSCFIYLLCLCAHSVVISHFVRFWFYFRFTFRDFAAALANRPTLSLSIFKLVKDTRG